MTDLRQQLVRSIADEGSHIRLVPHRTVSFAAFQVSNIGANASAWRTYDVGELAAATLPDALNEALTRKLFDHKDHLLIRETGERGVKLHLYAIKQKSRPRYVLKDHVTRAVRDLYPAHLCTIDGGIFA